MRAPVRLELVKRRLVFPPVLFDRGMQNLVQHAIARSRRFQNEFGDIVFFREVPYVNQKILTT
jgi:hypothetical protein